MDEDDVMDHHSFSVTDNSISKIKGNVGKPNFVILGTADSKTVSVYLVWKIKAPGHESSGAHFVLLV